MDVQDLYLDNWGLNPFGTGQCLPTGVDRLTTSASKLSQSLWNRAVSSDKGTIPQIIGSYGVSIPLEQGSVFRLIHGSTPQKQMLVSIPLEQGSVFRLGLIRCTL